MTFNVGDRVQWKSQSASFSKMKQGVVVWVVGPGECVWKRDWELIYNSSKLGGGMPRNHESYLVMVGKRTLYWPRVKHLEPQP